MTLPIELYQPPFPACLEWDPEAPVVARRVADLITARMPPLTIEHVGSTSVPGCAGKGLIDLMVLYPPGGLEGARDTLDGLGFQRQKNRDPFPEERPMRTGSIVHQGRRYNLHAHVLAEDSPEVVELRTFRDRLRADPALLEEYVAAKQAVLEAGVEDSLAYAYAKGPWIERWLKANGLRP